MSRNLILLACAWLLTSTGETSNPVVAAPPKSLMLAPFYKKYLDANGIPVIGSEKVNDQALIAARELILKMLSKREDLRKALVANKTRVAVMAESEVTVDVPEHNDLYQACPGTDWNVRCRGVGATKARPVCSVGEENLLGSASDRYRGESILIHEFGHTIVTMGAADRDSKLVQAIAKAYKKAMEKGLWKNTYAASNVDEYWAEGAQDWFDANLQSVPTNGIHNEICARKELKGYDSDLANLLAQVFPDDEWRYHYPSSSPVTEVSVKK